MNVRTKTEVTEETRHREPLTRDRIIEAALGVMDAEGLEAVTMRRIGRELGVEAMSLYNHVEDKDDILEGVTERVMNEFEFPPPPAHGPTTPERCLASGAGSSACIRASASSWRSATSRSTVSRRSGRWTPRSGCCVAPAYRPSTPRRRSTRWAATSWAS